MNISTSNKAPQPEPKVIHYRLDKSFGPSGGVVGSFLMIVGVFTIHLSISGWILLLLGSFMAFSAAGCAIDTEHFRIKFYNNLWGIWKVGKWKYVHRKMQLRLTHARMAYRVYSMSNRSVDVSEPDWRIFIHDGNSRQGQAICKFKNREAAEEELAKLSDWLNLSIRHEKEALG
ncbi:hypothetical protein [Geofilum rubicundum]|uniref:hypothetical protein n=1 Tax=Geofilum rubicundum TaxID=472113 RepID=UPI000781A9CB|nr:hypothetical protein [Geofilum rubicundum]